MPPEHMPSYQIPLFVAAVLALLAAGIWCVFFTRRAQAMVVRATDKFWAPSWNRRYVKSALYIWHLRGAGATALLMAAFMIAMIIKNGGF